MPPDAFPSGNTILRRYGLSASAEWQRLVSHLSIGRGFSLNVLLVPDSDGARLCHDELSGLLSSRQLELLDVKLETQDALRSSALQLPALSISRAVGAVWYSSVVTTGDPELPEWQLVWGQTLRGLNQQRNVIRRRIRCPLIIVGAPWMLPLFRDEAPDLWSIRTLVVRLMPASARSREDLDVPASAKTGIRDATAPDPSLALLEALLRRRRSGEDAQFARLLIRAARGVFERGKYKWASIILRRAASAWRSIDSLEEASEALQLLGLMLSNLNREAEAEATFREAIVLAEEAGAEASVRGLILSDLGRLLLAQNRYDESELILRAAVGLLSEGQDTPSAVAETLNNLGRALLIQDKLVEAEATFRRVLDLEQTEVRDALHKAMILHHLGEAIRRQGRAQEAEASYRAAIRFEMQADEELNSRGSTSSALGIALLDQGRAAEAESAFRDSLSLIIEDDSTARVRGVRMDNLGLALLMQGRIIEAEDAFRKSLALAEAANDSSESIGISYYNLGRALLLQGRADEAEAVIKSAMSLLPMNQDNEAIRADITTKLQELSRIGRSTG